MQKITIQINGKDTEITLTSEQIAQIQKETDPMSDVYAYHNTTQEEFDKLYEKIPAHVKAFEKECMVVAYYNKGWKPDFNNKNDRKWYAWFYMDEFRLCYCDDCDAYSYCSARLLFKNEEDLKEAVVRFFDVFKESRLS